MAERTPLGALSYHSRNIPQSLFVYQLTGLGLYVE